MALSDGAFRIGKLVVKTPLSTFLKLKRELGTKKLWACANDCINRKRILLAFYGIFKIENRSQISGDMTFPRSCEAQN